MGEEIFPFFFVKKLIFIKTFSIFVKKKRSLIYGDDQALTI